MCAPRGLLARSPWILVSARRTAVPSAVTSRMLWTRGYSQHNCSPAPATSSDPRAAALRIEDARGLIKDVGRGRAAVQLPRTAMNESEELEIELPLIQLRDACQCHRCVDPQTKQRFFRTSEIPENVSPSEMEWLDQTENDAEKFLRINWETQGVTPHLTTLPVDEIRYPPAYFHQKYVAAGKPRLHWNKTDMEKAQHWISYNDYMKNDDLFLKALDSLSLYGLLFVHDIPDSREMVEKIATRMGPLRNTFYGSTWDVRHDPQAKNVAYTNQNLDFHMDLLYVQNPPGFQLLHCLRNSCDGGESLFVDAFGAAADLAPKSWKTLSTFKVPYHYNHKHEYYRKTRPVLEISEEDASKPLSYVNYSPPFQGPFHVHPEETKGWIKSVKAFISAMREFEGNIQDPSRVFELKLNPGQCVIFENRRVLHARRAFDTVAGERWLAGAYVDEDAVHSKIFTLKRNSGVFQGKI